jgi:hypothetical protein
MIIKVLLVLAILLVFVWFVRGHGTIKVTAAVKLVALLFFFFAVTAVIFPGFTNTIAHAVGVGRGADLLLYVLTLAFIGSSMGQYLHRKSDQARINRLARKVAIYEANINPANQKKLAKL